MATAGSSSETSEAKLTPAQEQVAQLVSSFCEQIERALGVPLPDETSALAYIDHHLSELREEDREPIISLVAAGAGAWFGEFIRKRVGGEWIGDGEDPRRLRLLLEPSFVYFSPVDLAYEAIFVGELDADDPRAPQGALIDGSFQLDGRPNPEASDEEKAAIAEALAAAQAEAEADEDESDSTAEPPTPRVHDPTSDREWMSARLGELSPVPDEQYYSLTGRFESLELVLEMLAHRRVAEGKGPRSWALADYVSAIAN